MSKLDKVIAFLNDELDKKAKKEKKTVIDKQKKDNTDFSSVKVKTKKVK